ncbi:MAG: FAD-dependent oxidoreductase [Acidobacteria bacterium]|nr:MAG: FAD-dependent oxidoreductase [Acidobacteriota bacterium]
MSIRIDRREFLKVGLLAASAHLASQHRWSFVPKPLPPTASSKRILIIGAGLAGLVAAYELTQAGHDVTILEAQLRPGGRVLTLREPFSDGLYAEAGAARIPDNHDLTLHYVKHFGLTLVPFYPDKLARVFVLRGKRIRIQPGTELDLSQVPFELTAEERRLGMSGLLQKYLGGALRAMGDPSVPDWPSGSAKAYDNISMPEFLRQQGASHGAIELLEYPYASAEDDPTSFLWTLRENWYEAQETTRYKISGGNDLLPKAFAAKLKEKIHYGSPVVRIEQDSNKVRAIAVQSGTHHTFEADRLICTVPFPALRRVEVQPPFSERKRKAIAELTYDPVTRVILQCRSRFWEKDGYNGFGISDLPQEIFHPTFDQPGTRGLLVSYLLTGVGKRVGAMDPDRRTEFVSREMEKVHPGLLNHLEGCVSKVWPADPWAGGAGAEHSPGQLTTFCVGIERAEGRVHFAGEHTSGYPYWMQGALQSGLRAAEEVNEPR